MPIRPEDRHRYPPEWPEIRSRILARAGGLCECLGECGLDHELHPWAVARCNAPDRERIRRMVSHPARWEIGDDPAVQNAAWRPPILVILTVAHLDHTPENVDEENLRALCQLCHLRLDRFHHGRRAAETRARRKREALEAAGQGVLLEAEAPPGRD